MAYSGLPGDVFGGPARELQVRAVLFALRIRGGGPVRGVQGQLVGVEAPGEVSSWRRERRRPGAMTSTGANVEESVSSAMFHVKHSRSKRPLSAPRPASTAFEWSTALDGTGAEVASHRTDVLDLASLDCGHSLPTPLRRFHVEHPSAGRSKSLFGDRRGCGRRSLERFLADRAGDELPPARNSGCNLPHADSVLSGVALSGALPLTPTPATIVP